MTNACPKCLASMTTSVSTVASGEIQVRVGCEGEDTHGPGVKYGVTVKFPAGYGEGAALAYVEQEIARGGVGAATE